jgi:hypothetical protein
MLATTGTSPFGALEFNEMSVTYIAGQAVGTQLQLQGTADGRALTLIAHLRPELDSEGLPAPVSPAGSYRADGVGIVRGLDNGQCVLHSLAADVAVSQHEAPSYPTAADPIFFDGTLTVTGAGFNFKVSFEARKSCGMTRDD